MNQVRLSYEERRQLIEAAGVEIANRNGIVACSYFAIASHCSKTVPTSVATVRSYYRTKTDLWRSIVKHPKASPDVRKVGETIGLTV